MITEPRHISSPALRITIGTIGTPACIAMWKAPFLNGPRRGVAERVPSGAIASESPRASLLDDRAPAPRCACSVFAAVDEGHARRAGELPEDGLARASFLATPVKSRRSSFMTITARRARSGG